MNEEQKAWFEKLKTLVNGPVPTDSSTYDTLVCQVMDLVEESPEP